MEHFTPPVSARDLLFVLFKWKWSVIVILLVGLLASVVWLWVIRDDVYELNAKLLVKIGREQAPPTTTLNERPMNVVGQRAQQDVNSEADILASSDLLGELIDELHLDAPPMPVAYPAGHFARLRWHAKEVSRRFKDFTDETLVSIGLRPKLTPREKVLAALKDGLHVTAQKDSNVLVAQLFVRSREGSNVLLNRLVDKYLVSRLKVWQGEGALDFFRAQVSRNDEALRQSEQDVRTFESTWGINSLARQQEVLLTAIAEARARYRVADVELKEAQSKVERLDQQIAKADPDFAALGAFESGSFIDSRMLELSNLQRERERLRMTELDTSPRIQNVVNQFSLLWGDIRDNLRAVLLEKIANRNVRESEMVSLQRELDALHGKESEWHDRQRRVKVLEEAYLMYRAKLNEAAGLAELDDRLIGNVAVIERATDPLKPAGMRKLTLLGISIAVIVLVAFSWISIAEFFDHGVYTAGALESCVGAPVLAVVPAGKPARTRETLARSRLAVSSGIDV